MFVARVLVWEWSRAVPAFLSVGLGAEGYFMSIARESVRERSPAEVSLAG